MVRRLSHDSGNIGEETTMAARHSSVQQNNDFTNKIGLKIGAKLDGDMLMAKR